MATLSHLVRLPRYGAGENARAPRTDAWAAYATPWAAIRYVGGGASWGVGIAAGTYTGQNTEVPFANAGAIATVTLAPGATFAYAVKTGSPCIGAGASGTNIGFAPADTL